MNKLMIFPVVLLFTMVVLMSMQGASVNDASVTVNETSHDDTRHIWNLWGLIQNDPDATGNTMVWSAVGILACLIGAIAISMASGLSIIGSGLSEYSQKLIFIGVFWLPTWGILSAASLSIISLGDAWNLGMYLWLGLTLCFAIGIVIEATGSQAAN